MGISTNNLGWVVQQFIQEQGWIAVCKPVPTEEEAYILLAENYSSDETPHRVYEFLDHERNAMLQTQFSDNASNAVEQSIVTRGLKGRRVTPDDLKKQIASEHYFNGLDAVSSPLAINKGEQKPNQEALKLVTFCILVLRNGYTIVGTSACADPTNYDRFFGQQLARKHAVEQMWPLMGYCLKETLYKETNEQ